MQTYQTSERSRIKRRQQRAFYDRQTVHGILDASFVCHVGFCVNGQAFVIPTAYGRWEEEIILHGAPASRMIALARNPETSFCVTVTLLDGLVLARSALHHSMNYRSVVVFGRGRMIEERAEKNEALRVFMEHVLPGRWEEARKPTDKELDQTGVIAVSIEEASAKIRGGPPVDEEADLTLPFWAGVVPMANTWGPPESDDAGQAIALPQSLTQRRLKA